MVPGMVAAPSHPGDAAGGDGWSGEPATAPADGAARGPDGGGVRPRYPIESVDNALKLLLLFGERPRVRLTDASAYLGVASSTAHRLLAMLQYRGFVRQDAGSRAYEAGPALSSIAFSVIRRLDVRTVARPVLERVGAETCETVHLGRLQGREVYFLDSIEGSQAVRVGSRLGRSMPAHCTSTGKAMLSQLDREELYALYPGESLEQLTGRSISSRTALEADLEKIRRRGFAVSNQESQDGVASVAVALSGLTGARYAVNASLPANRLTVAVRGSIVRSLTGAAAQLSTALV
jgi:IclR family acetate operon transcriptional repressor